MKTGNLFTKNIAMLRALIFPLAIVLTHVQLEASPPNIIAILVDDVGVGDLGFTGGKDFPTPNIDRFAREGVVFTNGYAMPMCSPTRAALLTGRYPQRFGIEDNRPLDGQTDGMDINEVTLPIKLRENGYHTRLIGKWHLGQGDRFEFAPRNRGFDEFFGYFGAAGAYLNPVLSRNGNLKEYPGYNTDILTDEACSFLMSTHDKPFFLHLAYMAAHYPHAAKSEDIQRVPTLSGKRQTAAAILTNLDDNLGKLLATLKESKLDETTLIFFISDNGGEPPVLGTTNGSFRGQKFGVYEGGIRVPFAMRWPGKIPAGVRYDSMVHVMDVFPTSLAAAGVSPDSSTAIDGVNLLPFVQGTDTASPHEKLCWLVGDNKQWRIPGRDTNLARKLIGIREGNFKLVQLGGEPPQLFDLSNDPGESTDLSSQTPHRVAAMKADFDQWRLQMKPQVIPDDHPLYGKKRNKTPGGLKSKAKDKARPTAANAKEPFVGSVPSGGRVPKMNVPEQTQYPLPDRDRFGGFSGVQLERSTNFRVEQVHGRWVFVTPDGHPYVAMGPNHTGPTIRDQGRNNGLWARFGNSPDVAAVEMLKIIQSMGFTAGDVYQSESTYTRTLPWITFFWYGDQNQTFIDVFDPTAMQDVTRRAYEHAVSVADNPWVLGIGGPDLSIWDDKLVRMYRNLKPTSAGRIRYQEFLRDRYDNQIDKFNKVYRTNYTSFEELATQSKIVYPIDAENDKLDPAVLRWRLPIAPEKSANSAMQSDNDAFSALVASTLFPQVREAVKRGAPNHLFFGEHLAVRMIPDAVISAMAPHVDAYLAQAVEVSPQRPPEWQLFQVERWKHEYELLKKPIIIVDWGAVFSYGEAFEYKNATIKPEKEASDEAGQFVVDAFDQPYIIGLFLCKLMGDHRNDENFFQKRATRTYLKSDGRPYFYRTSRLQQALFEAQSRVLRQCNQP
jgi:arylsulfatase A-like enzyme